MSTKSNLLIGALLFLLPSCYDKQMVSDLTSQISDDFKESQDALDRARVPGRPIQKNQISVSDDIWLGDHSTVVEHTERLPKIFETEDGITMVTDEPVEIDDIMNQIQFLTNINVRIEETVKRDNIKKIAISYTGGLSGLLDMLANNMGLEWSFRSGRITFYKYKTRTFVLHTLSTTSTYSSNITSGSDSAASLQTTASIKEWEEIQAVVKSIVTDGELQVSPSTNSITITSTPQILNRVESYVREQNRRLAKQVAVTVKVLQISLARSNDFGLDLTAIFNSTFSAAAPSNLTSTGTAGLNFAILRDSDNNLAGTTAAIQALSTQGKTSLVTSSVVTTRNNRVVPINNVQTFRYVSSVSTLTENTNSTTEITPGQEDVGFSMQILPNILENGRLILMFNMSLKELVSLETFTAGEVQIQLPRIDQRNFMQEIVMESGQTAVLTGFEKIRNDNSSSGLGNNTFTPIGGNMSSNTTRDVLVVMLTPQVIQSPLEQGTASSNDFWGMPTY